MYSQFSFAQQTGTSQGVVQQAGVTWNGREWISSVPVVVSSPPPPRDVQLPPCPPHLPMPDLLRTPVAALVTHFSLAYQYFVELMNLKNSEAGTVGKTSDEQEEAKRQAAWHKYHADLSARYAHHYNNFQSTPSIAQSTAAAPNATSTPNGISSANSTLIKTKLKPMEATSSASSSPIIQKATLKSSSSSSSSSSAVPPASFQRFAHRCLSQCENDIQRSSMEKQIASTIETAIKEGYMHTKNWDIEPQLSIKLDIKAFLGRKVTSEPSSLHATAKPKAKALHLSDDVPESFRRYAQKCLAQCDNDIQRVSMEQQLLKRMEQAISEGSMKTRHWDDEPELNIKLDIKSFLARKISSASTKVSEESTRGIKIKPTASRALSGSAVLSGESPIIPPIPVRAKSLSEMDSMEKGVISQSILKGMIPHNEEGMKLKRKYPDYDPDFDDKDSYQDHDPVDSYYGPAVATRQVDSPFDGSYYGPSTAKGMTYAKVVTNARMESNLHKESLPKNESYYGNSSNRPVFQSNLSKSNISDDKVTPASKTPSKPYNVPGNINSIAEEYKRDSFIDNPAFGDYISLASKAPKRTASSSLKPQKHSSIHEKLSPDKSLEKLSHRANRFSGKGGLSEAVSSELHSEYLSGTDKYMGISFIGGSQGPSKKSKLDEQDYEKMTVKGTCETLEKDYLRLTAPPRAELVRPQDVLQAHLKNLKKRWRRQNSKVGSPNKKIASTKGIEGLKDYSWFCSQLKAVRQDLTVQRIINDLTVDCYETHARIALEEGDLNEYNQCQTKLKEIYDILRHGVPKTTEQTKSPLSTTTTTTTTTTLQPKGLQNESEFIAYRIIYYCLLTGNKKYDGGSSDLMKILKSITVNQRSNTFIAHAIHVREAVASDDYHSFFRLKDACPNHGIFLMEKIEPQMRAMGLQRILKAYRPTVSMDFVCQELALGGIYEGKIWLESCGCKLTDDFTCILTKDSELKESELCGKRVSSLI